MADALAKNCMNLKLPKNLENFVLGIVSVELVAITNYQQASCFKNTLRMISSIKKDEE